MFGWKQVCVALDDFRRDRRGVAGIEFAFIAGFMSLAIVNVSDTAIYLYKRMEVENAALVGTMSALKACDPSHLPATLYCSGLTAGDGRIQSTSGVRWAPVAVQSLRVTTASTHRTSCNL